MIDYGKVLQRFGIAPKGALHVGGFDGAEDASYVALGFRHRLFMEAQPDTFGRLAARLKDSGAFCENYAASDSSGVATFHVANNGQSSSLLKMEKHLDVYPEITETEAIRVKTLRIDELLSWDKYVGCDFNFMNVDIQGAELLALSGACASLRNFDILNLEVNFDRLYDGAPHITQLDAFLLAFDFVRADTILAHSTWGDAIYVKHKYTKA